MKILKFYNNQCGPCRAVAPLIDSYKDVADIVPVNTHEEANASLLKEYQIRGVPTIVVDNGRKTVKLMGTHEITKKNLDSLLR